MSVSNYLENAWVNHVLRNTAYTSPGTSIYVSAHTADPGETGANELSGGGYQRVQCSSWSSPSSRSITNSNAIIFPYMAAAVGTVTYYGVWDALSSGNFLYSTSSVTGIATAVGKAITIAAAAFSISLTGEISTYLSHALLNHTFRNTAYTTPGTSLYASLHTADPGLTGASECSGNAYARVQVSAWNSPSDGATANTNAINWPTPTPSSYGTATHMGLLDAAINGNFLLVANLDVSYLTNTSTAPSCAAGDFDVVVQ